MINAGEIIQAAKYIGAGLAMGGATGAGIGIGLSALGALVALARNPEKESKYLMWMILGFAFSETIAIYCIAVAFMILVVL